MTGRDRRRNGRNGSNGNGSILNAGTLVNILIIPVLTVSFYFIGSYFLTGDTLRRHELEIAAEASQREKLSNSLLNYAQKTQEGISALSSHAEVQDERIKQITGTLDHVVSGLQNIESRLPERAPTAH
jgi:capsule polysaccharide export protein KpsE/RkpR